MGRVIYTADSRKPDDTGALLRISEKTQSQTVDKRDPKTLALWGFMPIALVVIIVGYFISTNRTASANVSSYVPVTFETAPVVKVGFIGDSNARGPGRR